MTVKPGLTSETPRVQTPRPPSEPGDTTSSRVPQRSPDPHDRAMDGPLNAPCPNCGIRRSRRRWRQSVGLAIALIALVALFTPTTAHAHALGLSTLELRVDAPHVQAVLTADFEHLDLAAGLDRNGDGRVAKRELADGAEDLETYLSRRLQIRTGDGAACAGEMTGLHYDAVRTAGVIVMRYTCPTPLGRLEIEGRVFAEQPGQHRIVGSIAETVRRPAESRDDARAEADERPIHPERDANDDPGGSADPERSAAGTDPEGRATTRAGPRFAFELTRDDPIIEFETAPPDATEPAAQDDPGLERDDWFGVVKRYLWLGIEHILLGLDHVLFIITLLLVARRLRHVLVAVTTFTLAHSVTLALAALDVMAPPASLVEPLIALSIAVVAAENIVRETARTRGEPVLGLTPEPRARALVVALFGLVHGFGFAGVLMDLGLPAERVVPALAAFNIGVELGQIAIVLVVWPVLWVFMRRPGYPRFARIASGGALVAALVWLVERLGFA